MFFERTFKKNLKKLPFWNRVQLFVMQKYTKTIAVVFFVTPVNSE